MWVNCIELRVTFEKLPGLIINPSVNERVQQQNAD